MEKPKYIKVTDKNSFALKTIMTRLPNIAQQVIDLNNNSIDEDSIENIISLQNEIKTSFDSFIDIDNQVSKFSDVWIKQIKKYLIEDGTEEKLEDLTKLVWADISFFLLENLFYQLMFEKVKLNGDHFDYFRKSKEISYATAKDAIITMIEFSINLSEKKVNENFVPDEKEIENLLYSCLWGNRVDLSLFKPNESRAESMDGISKLNENLLVDDSNIISDHLLNKNCEGKKRLDVILDNFGYEFLTDVVLCEYLLSTNVVDVVVLHTKRNPYFVSDTMNQDVHNFIRLVENDSNHLNNVALETFINNFKERIVVLKGEDYFTSVDSVISEFDKKIIIVDNDFWTLPYEFEDFTDELYDYLSSSFLCIIKGDLNYRKLIGDRHWDFTSDFNQITSYFPCPFATLRTLKCELVVGLTEDQLSNKEDNWTVIGKYGTIHFSNPLSSSN
eukprot:TRINITY_DN10459_c0_g1_i1.p1 TRINITY_DN10459_c0_g1~~TRINITY_DN10459_c0_g1_i1.p1  ORF type:complete len:445 (-),score=114.06 TRINITY_DN10459_c0_g1_i1:143-1477(-)